MRDVSRSDAARGSSLDTYRNALDQERAASMADEGGAAGAITDAREQIAGAKREGVLPPVARQRRTGMMKAVCLAVIAVPPIVMLWLHRSRAAT